MHSASSDFKATRLALEAHLRTLAEVSSRGDLAGAGAVWELGEAIVALRATLLAHLELQALDK